MDEWLPNLDLFTKRKQLSFSVDITKGFLLENEVPLVGQNPSIWSKQLSVACIRYSAVAVTKQHDQDSL